MFPHARRQGVGGLKWASSVLGPDSFIYAVPYDATHVLKFDTTTLSASSVGQHLGTQAGKLFATCLGPDQCVYGVPHNSHYILRFDPTSQTTILIGVGLLSGSAK